VPKRREGEIPHNKLAGEGRSGGTHPATRSRKAYKGGGGRKTPQEKGKAHSHMNCK
jgi:hypothetical protein